MRAGVFPHSPVHRRPSICPLVSSGRPVRNGIDEPLFVAVDVRVTHSQRLAMRFGGKLWRADVRHPNLYRPQSSFAQPLPMRTHLVTGSDGLCCRHLRSLLVTCNLPRFRSHRSDAGACAVDWQAHLSRPRVGRGTMPVAARRDGRRARHSGVARCATISVWVRQLRNVSFGTAVAPSCDDLTAARPLSSRETVCPLVSSRLSTGIDTFAPKRQPPCFGLRRPWMPPDSAVTWTR